MAICPECRTHFTRVREDQLFCTTRLPRCKDAAKNREMLRSRAVYRVLYWWRYDRRTAAASLGFLCREIREWINDDKLHQRLPPPRHDHTRDRGMQTKRMTFKAATYQGEDLND